LKKTAHRNSIAPMLRRTLAAVCAALCGLVLASCGARAVGYGVVLWGEKTGAPQTGTVVAIVQESTVGASLLIGVPGERKPREYPMGRIRVFRGRSEAQAFAAAFAANLGSWAVVMKEDAPPLPVRDSPGQDGKVVYRLQFKQLVKVVSRSPEMATVKPYTDYWYEVATEDGFSGWCFGHFLKPFSVSGDPTAEAQHILSQDEVLARIMGTTWRPSWFLDMTAKGAIDLSMFREDVGLFASPTERLMKLVLPLSTFEFRYTGEPVKAGAASYTFPGTDLRIDVLDEERINVSYRYKDQPKTELYVVVKDDVAQLVADEQQRRADIYDALLKKGTTLASSAYGTIRLLPGMRFSWDGFSKLVPSLIPAEARGKGSLDFTLHVRKELMPEYDGAVTFVFDEAPKAGLSFLYKAATGGLRFTSLARDSVQDLFVTHPSLSPVVVFFTQTP
jgi:hypothetical protein